MVSVIVPNYNHAPYLSQRIESILSQTWSDFELIILDDCSTDDSREILEKYRGHPKLSAIIYNEANSGNTFKQWIKGIEHCKSEFVWIAESDDWCEPSFLENIMSGMLAQPDCVVGFCQSYCILDANLIDWKSNSPYLRQYIEGKQFVNDFMLANTAIFNASMAVWRRSFFEGVDRDFVQFRSCGDWLFWIELCMQGKVFVSGKALNYFRKHNLNVSNNSYQTGENFVEELKMFELLVGKKLITQAKHLEILKQQYVHYRAVNRNFTSEKNERIKALFFSDKRSRAVLTKHYLRFYSSYAIKSLLKKLYNALLFVNRKEQRQLSSSI